VIKDLPNMGTDVHSCLCSYNLCFYR
jgi:hypothetical protein